MNHPLFFMKKANESGLSFILGSWGMPEKDTHVCAILSLSYSHFHG